MNIRTDAQILSTIDLLKNNKSKISEYNKAYDNIHQRIDGSIKVLENKLTNIVEIQSILGHFDVDYMYGAIDSVDYLMGNIDEKQLIY